MPEPKAFPNFRAVDESPPAPPAGGIALVAPSSVPESGVLPVYGSFLIEKSVAAEFGRNALRAVVLLVRNPLPATLAVADGRLVFDDDLQDEGEHTRGFFNVELFDAFALEREQSRYWVSASIFGHTSDVVTIDVI